MCQYCSKNLHIESSQEPYGVGINIPSLFSYEDFAVLRSLVTGLRSDI